MFPAAVLPRVGEVDSSIGVLTRGEREVPPELLASLYFDIVEPRRFKRSLKLLEIYDIEHGLINPDIKKSDDYHGSGFYKEEQIEYDFVFGRTSEDYEVNGIYEFFRISLLEYESLTFSEQETICRLASEATDRRMKAIELEKERAKLEAEKGANREGMGMNNMQHFKK